MSAWEKDMEEKFANLEKKVDDLLNSEMWWDKERDGVLKEISELKERIVDKDWLESHHQQEREYQKGLSQCITYIRDIRDVLRELKGMWKAHLIDVHDYDEDLAEEMIEECIKLKQLDAKDDDSAFIKEVCKTIKETERKLKNDGEKSFRIHCAECGSEELTHEPKEPPEDVFESMIDHTHDEEDKEYAEFIEELKKKKEND